MSLLKTTPEMIARLQKCIDTHKLANPHQVSRLSRGWGVSLRILQELFADGRLHKHPEGQDNKTGKLTKSTPENITWLQNVIDARAYKTPHQLYSDAEVAQRGLSATVVKDLATKRLIRFTDDALLDGETIRSLLCRFSPKDLKLLAGTGQVRIMPNQAPIPEINFEGDRIRSLALTDPHGGSIYFKDEMWDAMVKVAKKEGCDFATISGDLSQGMKNSTGDELVVAGFEAQANYMVDRIAMLKMPVYFCDGNHDRWYLKDNGADICQAIQDRLVAKKVDAHYLGHDEGDINLKHKVLMRLWHGEDTSSYAVSYRIQKLVEAYTGGEKPHILIAGHTHKSMYLPERHVHCISGGAMCVQSRWMRSKRLANHSGFWILDTWVNKDGVARFTQTWYPFYA